MNVFIDWGDGSAPEKVTAVGLKEHTYATAGTYIVKITGSLTGFGDPTGSTYTYTGFGAKLTEVTSWGEVGLIDLSWAFQEASNLIAVPPTLPPGVTSIKGMFNKATLFNGDISGWDVSKCTDMSLVFQYASAFNQDISSWDVSNVTNMYCMFTFAYKFNQDISSWDVSKVEMMAGMFTSDSVFNQDLTSWTLNASLLCFGFIGSGSAFECTNAAGALLACITGNCLV